MEIVNLTWWQKLLKFLVFPGIIANIFNALTMGPEGYSLKKILACYGTWIAGNVTDKWACKENAIAFAILWLAWVGILIGIYSFKDITEALAKFKGTSPSNIDQVVPDTKVN